MPRTESPDKWRAMRKPKAPGKSRSDILAAAADEFARHGFNGSRLEAEGYGADHPVANNDTEQGRQQNRRIDVRVTEK